MNKDNNKSEIKKFLIKLAAITFAIIVIINVTYNLIFAEKLENINNPILICNEEHRFIVAEQLREIDIKPNSIILEPIGRNTAPSIIIAALQSLKSDKDSMLLILSSDHLMNCDENFKIGLFMTKKPFTVEENTLATEILSQMNKRKITNVCVYNKSNKKKIIGVIHIHNLLNVLK